MLTQVFPPSPGGSGRWLWELYRRLTDLDVSVAAGEAAGSEAFDREAALSIDRVPLRFPDWGLSSSRGISAYVRAARAIVRLVRARPPDQIHCGKCLPEGLLATGMLRWRGIPFCCFVHGEELTLAATSRELKWLTKTVIGSADTLIANSAHTQSILATDWGIHADKVTVLHPGVDTQRFVPAVADDDVRKSLGWSNRRVVLTVGALQRRKGQDMMIQALPAIRARCPDVLYAIVGEGWEREYLEQLAASHDVLECVQFLGVPEDAQLVQLYQQCDVFALPNRQVGWDIEGFGIVLLEAQACGKPVIAGASGGAPETMSPGQTGLLVAAECPGPLADAVAALLEDSELRAIMGQRAREWVVERFAWDVMIERARGLFSAA